MTQREELNHKHSPNHTLLKAASFHSNWSSYFPKHLKWSWIHSFQQNTRTECVKIPLLTLTGVPTVNMNCSHLFFHLSAKPFFCKPNERTTCEQQFLTTTRTQSHFSFCEHLIYRKWDHMQFPQAGRRVNWTYILVSDDISQYLRQKTTKSCMQSTSTWQGKGNHTQTLNRFEISH